MDQPLSNHQTGAGSALPDVVILCGGLGTRLREVVADRPKVLAEVGGKPFIDLLLARLRAQGFSRFILCIGYGGEAVKRHFKGKANTPIFSEESSPLGTGGALKHAWTKIQSDTAVVLNGDTYCSLSLWEFLHFHAQKRASVSLVVTSALRDDGGGIVLGTNDEVQAFTEKGGVGSEHYLNAGIYAFSRTVDATFPEASAFSLEYDWFPSLPKRMPCFGFVTKERVIDIGTPERYRDANRHFSSEL